MNKAAGECKPQLRLARVELAPPRGNTGQIRIHIVSGGQITQLE